MRYLLLRFSTFGAVAAFAAGTAYANDALIKMSENPKDWVMPARTYDAQRYSPLKQINTTNVGKLQAAWCFRPACCADMKARRW
jgi:lanthanide-dependent methanol dehydrogenase